jgi:chromosome segregation ATPase
MAVSIDAALKRLDAALDLLDDAIEGRLESVRHVADLEEEVHRLGTDRSELAQTLDDAEARGARLDDVNRQVSQRLDAAIETIRAVLDRQEA